MTIKTKEQVLSDVFDIYKAGLIVFGIDVCKLTQETKFWEKLRLNEGDEEVFVTPINRYLKTHGKTPLSKDVIIGCNNIKEVADKAWGKFS